MADGDSLVRLTALDVRDVRILARCALEPAGGINVIEGPNAAGKTSLLEAIHILGTARSFAATRMERVVRADAGPLRVTGRVAARGERREHRLGIERALKGRPLLRIDGRSVSRVAELAQVLPVIAVHPASHELVAGSPEERRRYLDLGLFHVERGFHETWQRYRRALEQRNALLRARRSATERSPWDHEVARWGERLSDFREGHAAELADQVADLGRRIAGLPVEVRYRRGWHAERSLADAMAEAREKDIEQGTTTVGPHRADLVLQLEGRDVRQRVSRGQQKLLVYVLRLAQARLLPRGCVLLLDDLSAELDATHRRTVVEAAAGLGVQVFVTSIEAGMVPLPPGVTCKVFHVEQGEAREVIQ